TVPTHRRCLVLLLGHGRPLARVRRVPDGLGEARCGSQHRPDRISSFGRAAPRERECFHQPGGRAGAWEPRSASFNAALNLIDRRRKVVGGVSVRSPRALVASLLERIAAGREREMGQISLLARAYRRLWCGDRQSWTRTGDVDSPTRPRDRGL